MVRTRADNTARKAVAAKAPRKVLGSSSSGASAAAAGLASPAGKYAGGNSYCPRPTPDWQKGMSGFLVKKPPKESDKENDEPQDVEMDQSSSSASAATKSPVKDSSEGSSSASASSSSGTSKTTKKNGLIDSDSDEE